MNWIQTYSGKVFDLSDPSAEMVCIEDIAHSLSLQCRFTGHIREFYSIAQHSVLCAERAKDDDLALRILLHDAHEAYVGDVSTPLKRMISPQYDAIAGIIQYVIEKKFGVVREGVYGDFVKEIDQRMLMTEARDLLGPQEKSWGIDVKPYEHIMITPWSSQMAELTFLNVFLLYRGRQ